MNNTFDNNTVLNLPKVEKVDFKQVEKNYLKVITFNVMLFFLVLFISVILIDYFDFFKLTKYYFWLYILVVLVFVITLLFKIIGFRKRKYVLREKDISYKEGVFFKNLTTVPFNRIQHIEIDQGPVSRWYGLVSLSVFTAGDSSEDLEIRGLLESDAKQIKEYISTKIDG